MNRNTVWIAMWVDGVTTTAEVFSSAELAVAAQMQIEGDRPDIHVKVAAMNVDGRFREKVPNV